LFTNSPAIKLVSDEAKSSKQNRLVRYSTSDIVLEAVKYETSHIIEGKMDGCIIGRIQNESSCSPPPASPVSLVSSSSSCLSSDSNSIMKPQVFGDQTNQVKEGTQVEVAKKSNFSPSGFHKVLNKIVETGIQVTKSKLSDSHSNENHFELINGYEETPSFVPPKTKPKKRSYSYKSNSLTRLGKQHLFKINELESANKNDDSVENKLNNAVSSSKNSPSKSPRSKSYHNSLPSRNFKVVDDIKSLFDKLTSSKHSSGKNLTKETYEMNAVEAKTVASYLDNSKLSSFKNSLTRGESSAVIKLKTSQSFQPADSLKSKKRLNQECDAQKNSTALSSQSFSSIQQSVIDANDANHSNNRIIVYKPVKQVTPDVDLESPDSPRKGALKKNGVSRDSSLNRSPLKVRWKDMIEISNCTNESDSDTDPCSTDISHESIDLKKTDREERSKNASLMNNFQNDIIISIEKKHYGRKQQQFNLKPLHATGKEFEKEMMERLSRLNKIKSKTLLDMNDSEKFYDDVHADLDVVLFELHSTIEHVRLSSMLDKFEDEFLNVDMNEEVYTGDSLACKIMNSKLEEKIADVAVICRQFVNNSKSMISSALVNEDQVKPHVRSAMNSLCSLVVECLETNYKYLYKNKKLDETRQLLIQILNLLNTFRTTLNITYLASSKQLNESNINLLMKQATNLANEISLLIKHFKQLF